MPKAVRFLFAVAYCGLAAGSHDPVRTWEEYIACHKPLSLPVVDRLYENPEELAVFGYDFDQLARIEKELAGIDRQESLTRLFRAARGADDRETWFTLLDWIGASIIHSPVTQPMYPDRTMVTDPLVLLELGEGRCGHIARIVVDLGLANGFEPRLVQLAAHVVAEVRWGGAWHAIDADAGFKNYRAAFSGLPDVLELSRNPYALDALCARGWAFGTNYERTLQGQTFPKDLLYPWNLKTSSLYFGKEAFTNQFGSPASPPRSGLIYYYKNGNPAAWQNDRYYGWLDLHSETQPVAMVLVRYDPTRPRLSTPSRLISINGRLMLPVRFWPAVAVVQGPQGVRDIREATAPITYEIRVSSKTRNWDCVFRNFLFMGESGTGDLARTRSVRDFGDGWLGADIVLNFARELFVEVVPQTSSSDFLWPSNEEKVAGVETKQDGPHKRPGQAGRNRP